MLSGFVKQISSLQDSNSFYNKPRPSLRYDLGYDIKGLSGLRSNLLNTLLVQKVLIRKLRTCIRWVSAMLKQKKQRTRRVSILSKKVAKQMHLYSFPNVDGLEEISAKLNFHAAENIFSALCYAVELKPITDNESAIRAECMLEYIGRAFEKEAPHQVQDYQHVLGMLIKEYDDKHHVRASKDMPSHEFLRAMLIEDHLPQKSLVPDCFPTESQVSEFLHQKKGRQKLSYEQAVLLGKKFKVDPLNFLQ